MPSAPSITPFSYDAGAGAAPTAIGFEGIRKFVCGS